MWMAEVFTRRRFTQGAAVLSTAVLMPKRVRKPKPTTPTTTTTTTTTTTRAATTTFLLDESGTQILDHAGGPIMTET